jgi:hypothetical protein
MKIKDIIESSPDTPKGSVSRDLLISKMWLSQTLVTMGLNEFDNIYVLGSWYGATAIVINQFDITFDTIICVDNNQRKITYFDSLVKKKGYSDIVSVCKDANDIEFQGDNILIINSSTNDILGSKWLENIPAGTVVALQGKNHQERSNGIETLTDFNNEYPLSKTLFVGELEVKDVEGNPYDRFMKIGYR